MATHRSTLRRNKPTSMASAAVLVGYIKA